MRPEARLAVGDERFVPSIVRTLKRDQARARVKQERPSCGTKKQNASDFWRYARPMCYAAQCNMKVGTLHVVQWTV